jgi:hypothetical protein
MIKEIHRALERIHISTMFVSVAIIIATIFLYTGSVSAVEEDVVVRDTTYRGVMVGQSTKDGTRVTAGETINVTFKFRNKGTATWSNSGSRYISAYTMEPRYRISSFQNSIWPSKRQAGVLKSSVAPGSTGEITISFTAPEKPGLYREAFYLAAENYSWVDGTAFYIEFQVVARVQEVAVKKPTNKYQAKRFIQSKREVTAAGGDQIELVLGFQNIGDVSWNNFQILSGSGVALASGETLSYADTSWQSREVVIVRDISVDPNKYVRETIVFRAPTKQGRYQLEFVPKIGDETLDDAKAIVEVTVTSDAPTHYTEPFGGVVVIPIETKLDTEPTIRVGLWRPESFVQFRSYDDDYSVYQGDRLVGVLPRAQFAVLKYSNGIYNLTAGDMKVEGADFIRLSPQTNPHAIFAIPNYSRVVSWKGPGNFNRYRGSLEFRMGEIKSDVWVINELLLEDYVEGIAENSNLSNMEYLKAQSVAQRSYAYFTKQADKYGVFDVVATTGDQLYLGANSESIMPRFVEAVRTTRGMMATYDGVVVVTPYFARTDGRTRNWTEVWGGAQKPWLISVTAEYDRSLGKSLLGHGVGMSQIDASMRAEKEGISWQELVKYYYRGVEVERMY